MILNVSSISILFLVQLKFQDKNSKFKVPTLSRVFLKIHFEELFSYTLTFFDSHKEILLKS